MRTDSHVYSRTNCDIEVSLFVPLIHSAWPTTVVGHSRVCPLDSGEIVLVLRFPDFDGSPPQSRRAPSRPADPLECSGSSAGIRLSDASTASSAFRILSVVDSSLCHDRVSVASAPSPSRRSPPLPSTPSTVSHEPTSPTSTRPRRTRPRRTVIHDVIHHLRCHPTRRALKTGSLLQNPTHLSNLPSRQVPLPLVVHHLSSIELSKIFPLRNTRDIPKSASLARYFNVLSRFRPSSSSSSCETKPSGTFGDLMSL